MRRTLPLLLLVLAAIVAVVILWPTDEGQRDVPSRTGDLQDGVSAPQAGQWDGETADALRAPAAGVLPVRVVDAAGDAVAEGTLHARIDDEPRRLDVVDGVARLPLGRTSVAAAAYADGHWSAWQSLSGEAMRGAQEMVLQVEDAEAAVALRVLLDDGSAAPAPRMLLSSLDPRADAALPLDGWTEGQDGDVRVERLAPGSYAATLAHDGCGGWSAQWTLEPGATHEQTVTLSRAGKLRGIVYGPNGPLGDARLMLAPAAMARQPFSGLDLFRAYGMEPPEVPDEAATSSGPDGAFVFENARPGEYLLLVATDDLLPYVHSPAVMVVPGGDTQAGRIELRPGNRVSVTVLDLDGQPLEGASVRWRASSEGALAQLADLWADAVDSDAQGTVELARMPAGLLVVQARHASGAVAEEVVEFPAVGVQQTSVTLQLGAGAALAGRVLRASDDAPVEGARVALIDTEAAGAGFFGRAAEEVVTTADGSFRFERQSPGRYLVRATFENLAPSLHGPVELGEGNAEPVLIRLEAGATLEVLARDELGLPLAEATVALSSSSTRVNEVATTDAGGTVSFEGLAAGDYQVALLGADFDPAAAQAGDLDIAMQFVTLVAGETRQLEIGGGGAAADVEGVITRRGEAVAGAMVVAVLPSGAKTSRTDETGRYDLKRVPVGSHVLMIQVVGGGIGGGSYYTGLEVPSSAAIRHDIVLPGAGVVILVRDAEGGGPVAGMPVSLRPSDGSHISGADFGITDTEGRARFDAVAPGEYVVAAGRSTMPMLAGQELDRYAAGQRRVTIAGGEERDEQVELLLGSGATFRARIADRDGNYLTGAHLYYLDERGQPLAILSMSGTNANGVAQLTGLPAGPGRILVRHARHGVKELQVDLRAGELHKQEIVLEGGTTLRVEVIDADGQPVAGVLAVAVDSRGAPLSTTWTMEESQAVRGAFFQGTAQTLGPLPAGRYTVRLVRPGSPPVEHPVTLDGSPEMRLRLRYDP